MRPGPEERKLSARLRFKLFGRWPDAVVAERLARMDYDPSNVNAIMREVYRDAGMPVPAEYLDNRRRGASLKKSVSAHETAQRDRNAAQ